MRCLQPAPRLQKVNPTNAQNVRAQALCYNHPALWFVVSAREDDVRSLVQEADPSGKTQRIASEVCNHDPWSHILTWKPLLPVCNNSLKWFNYFDKCSSASRISASLVETGWMRSKESLSKFNQNNFLSQRNNHLDQNLPAVSYYNDPLGSWIWVTFNWLLWFLQLLGFCGSFLWLVGQECGVDCSEHGKHLGQGGREAGRGRRGGCFFSDYCVNHPVFLLSSAIVWLPVAACYCINVPIEVSFCQLCSCIKSCLLISWKVVP